MEPSDQTSSSSSSRLPSSNLDDTEPLNLFPNNNQNALEPLPLISCLLRSPDQLPSYENPKAYTSSAHKEEDVTVALHIGLPEYSYVHMNIPNEIMGDTNVAPEKYWIPTLHHLVYLCIDGQTYVYVYLSTYLPTYPEISIKFTFLEKSVQFSSF